MNKNISDSAAFNASFATDKVIEENRRLHITYDELCASARSEEQRTWKASGRKNPRQD